MCIRFLILFEIMISEGSLLQNNYYFLQWQAFAVYRSASSGPVENVLTINITIENIFFIILFIMILFKKYWF